MISLRKIQLQDKELLFEWRNLDQIVLLSSSKKTVGYNEHIRWFSEVLSSGNVLAYIIENSSNISVGHIRFERNSDAYCTLTVYLLPSESGKGLGVEAIRLGCSYVYESWRGIKIIANVLSGNLNAQSAFKKAGFTQEKIKKLPDHVTFKLEY